MLGDANTDEPTGRSHLGEEEQEKRGGVHLEVSPLVVPDDGGAGPGVVLGVERV